MLSIYFKTDDWNEMDIDNFSLALNDTIQNIHNPVKLNTEYSKTISFPLTAKNREIIQHYSRLDSLVTTSFDPTKSIPTRIEVNGNTVFEGHFAATKFDMTRNRLEGNFYSVTNTWINKLKRLTWDDLPNCLPDDFEINKNTVFESWKAIPQNRSINFNLPGDTRHYHWTDWIGFAPTLTGELNDFSCDAMLKSNAGAETFHPWEVYGFTGAGLDIVKTIIPKPTERQMLQFRSYYQKPYIYVDNLFRLIEYYCNINDDLPYMQWDEDWTVETNANWRNLIYFLPNLLKSDEKPMSSTVVYNLDNPLRFNNSGFRMTDPTNHTITKESMLFELAPPDESAEPIISSDGWINGNGKSIDYILPVHFNLAFSFRTIFNSEDSPLNGWNRKMRLIGQISLQVELVDQNNVVLADSTKTIWNASQGSYPTNVTTQNSAGSMTWNLSWTMNGSGVYSHSFIATANTKYRPRYRWVFKNQYTSWRGVYDYSSMYLLFCADIANAEWDQAMYIQDTINPAWRGSSNLISFQTASQNTTSDIHRIKYAAPGRSGRKYTMKDIWSKEENNTPFMVMLKYIKMFNLVIVYDNLKDIIKIMPKEKFFAEGFANGVEDWTNKVDFGKEMSFKPLAWEDRWIEFNYNDADLAKMKSFKDKYGFNYGTKRIGTSYSFNNETKQLLEGGDSINVSGEMSEYMFNMYQLNRIASNPTATVQLEEAFLVNESYMINMKDDKMADMQNCFAYRANTNISWDNSVNRLTNGNYHNHIYITDDCQYENNNGTYCYQPVLSGNISWSMVETSVWSCQEYYCNALQLLLTNTKPKISHYCTRTLYQDGQFVNVDYCCLFSTPREDYFNPNIVIRNNRDLWTTRWSNLITEMYSEQNKLLTCWIYLTPEDYNSFKFNKFIIIDDVLYLVNKIIDYNPASLEATKCELIQVNDPDKYTTAPENEVRSTNIAMRELSKAGNTMTGTKYLGGTSPASDLYFNIELTTGSSITQTLQLRVKKTDYESPSVHIWTSTDGENWTAALDGGTTTYTTGTAPEFGRISGSSSNHTRLYIKLGEEESWEQFGHGHTISIDKQGSLISSTGGIPHNTPAGVTITGDIK